MKKFRLFYFLIVLLPALALSAGSADFSRLNLGMPSTSLTPYALGFTAFGVEDADIQTGELQFSPTYSYFNGYMKNAPEQGRDIYRFELSDISDPYQGFFYKLDAGGNPLLLHVNVNYSRLDENHKDGSINTGEGRLAASTRIGDFYLGALGIVQRIDDDISISGIDNPGPPTYTYQTFYNKVSDTNLYYQLSLGYKLSDTSSIGLQYDNIFNLSTNRDSVISFHDELFSTHFSPFLAAPTLMSSIYRFNASGEQNYYHHLKNDFTKYFEIQSSLMNHHFELFYKNSFNHFTFNALLSFYTIEYVSKIDVVTIDAYKKDGSFKNLYYDIYINDIYLLKANNNSITLSFHMQQILFANLKEKIARRDSPFFLQPGGISLDISFSRTLIEGFLTIQHDKHFDITVYCKLLQTSYYYKKYDKLTLEDIAILLDVYPGPGDPFFQLKGQGKDSMSIQTGLANRVYLSDALTFDLGAAFYQIDYDAKNTLKTNILTASAALGYALTPDARLGLSYQRLMYLTYEVQENSYKATQSQFGLDVQMKF